MSAIVLHRISKRFDRKIPVVRDLSLDIRNGELFVLVGPSGCGKTTTLRIIAGLERPDGGKVHIDGREVTRLAPARRNLSLIFQDYSLYPHLSTRGNLDYAMKLRRIPAKERETLRKEAIDLTGIAALLDRRAGQLSGGERQRVALAASIVRRPVAHLLDEPLSDLDLQARRELRTELRQLQQRLGATMVHVTHDQEEAMSLADRMAVMQGGEIRQTGSPAELYERPADRFVAGFLGSPAMNFIEGHLITTDDTLIFKDGHGVTLPPPSNLRDQLGRPRSRAVTYGIRPEHLRPMTVQSDDRGGGGSEGRLEAAILTTERLGDRTDLHARLKSGVTIIGRADPDAACPQPGQRVNFDFDPARAHLFEPGERGKRISDGGGEKTESRKQKTEIGPQG